MYDIEQYLFHKEKWNMQKFVTNRNASLIILIVILVLAGCSGAPVKPDRIIPGDYDYAKEQRAAYQNVP